MACAVVGCLPGGWWPLEPGAVSSLLLLYHYKSSAMKSSSTPATKAAKRQQIAEAMRASFRIEGIHISAEQAQAALRKVEASLGKASA